ncbi:MAG: alpha/beta hydrolase [Novosphingobium sp.]
MIFTKHVLVAAIAIACSPAAQAQTLPVPVAGSVAAPKGSVVIPVYGKDTPGSAADETVTRFMGRETVVRNVTYPTLTMVAPLPGKRNGAAVIVAPGGAFQMLAMQNEGWRVAQALVDHGVTAFVLKYRLNPTAKDDAIWLRQISKLFPSGSQSGKPPEIKDPEATKDALAALTLVRERSGQFGIDPHRVGMIGFSAGAITALNTVLEAGNDASTGTQSPDFIGYIYGPMSKVAVPTGAPPMFAALAMDDPLFGGGDFSIVTAWNAAKRPVELHAYQTGNHGFGLGRPNTTTTLMMAEFLGWMEMQGLLKAKTK